MSRHVKTSIAVGLIFLALIYAARFVPSEFVDKIKTQPETEQRIIPLGEFARWH